MILLVDNNINYYRDTIHPPKLEHNPAQPNRVGRSSQNATQRPIYLSVSSQNTCRACSNHAAVKKMTTFWCPVSLKKIHPLWPLKGSFSN